VTGVHPSAIVHPRARLAADVEVGPYSVIGEDVELAAGVVIGSHVTLLGRTTVGARTRISPFSVIGGEPQVQGASGESTALVIGEDNLIREFASIHLGSPDGGGCTRIGDGNFILNNVHIAHDCRIGNNCVLASFSALAGHVTLEDHVILGGLSGVHQFTRVGRFAFASGGAMVINDVAPYCMVQGDRAELSGLNTTGLKRAGFGDDQLARVKEAYRIVFRAGTPLREAIAQLRERFAGQPEIEHLARWLDGVGDRGLVR
jgi:UDP-N-acetylglucosamine acyltransferase